MPIGLRATDELLDVLANASGRCAPEAFDMERGRLIDAYVDAHKYLMGLRALVYGEEDLVVALSAFLAEIGIRPVLAATGGKSGALAEAIREATGDLLPEQPEVMEDVDFHEIGQAAKDLKPDLLIGNSKGYSLAKELRRPLIRVGFPISRPFRQPAPAAGGLRRSHVIAGPNRQYRPGRSSDRFHGRDTATCRGTPCAR